MLQVFVHFIKPKKKPLAIFSIIIFLLNEAIYIEIREMSSQNLSKKPKKAH